MILAAKDIEAQFFDRLYVYMWTGIALFSIGLLIWAILQMRSWFFESDESDVPNDEMMLQFRQLKREGELSEEEFRLISQRLTGVAKTQTSAVQSSSGFAPSPEVDPGSQSEVQDSE